MQAEHAVEERLLHVGAGAHVGVVQQNVPVGSDQARADVVDVEERLSERQLEAALVLPLPVQMVVARARQRGPRHHHDDDECPGGDDVR